MSIQCKLACCILVFAGLAGSTPTFAKARNKGKDKDNNADVKFTSRTELVLVPTLVTDKSGGHITGLKKEDFTVLENGAEQKIATFEEIVSNSQRLSVPGKPNEFSNSLADSSPGGRVTLIVLDFINTPYLDQTNARKELLKYLTESVDQREPTALYTLTRSGIHVIHDVTTDPRVLVAALHRVKGDLLQMVDKEGEVEAINEVASRDRNAVLDAAVQSEEGKIRGMLQDVELNFQSFEQRVAITYTLQGMQQVAQALAGFPGRKSLIWAGGGFPFSVSDNTMRLAPAGRDSLVDVLPMYEHTWQLLNNAQIALYPLDVKGLQVAIVPSATVLTPGSNYERNMSSQLLDTQATLQTFASMTGGRAYFNSNDLARGFRDAVRDSAQYYMLGYYLDRSNIKSGWRKLAVKVKRDHVQVRARSGFFVTNSTVDPESSRNADMSSALQSPLDYTSLPVVARWDKIEPARDPAKKHVNYQLHLAVDPTMVNQSENNRVAVEFFALAKTVEGKIVDSPSGQRFDSHLTAEKLAVLRDAGVVYRGALDLAPGEYTVRFVVRDDLSGRIGSVAAPLKVE